MSAAPGRPLERLIEGLSGAEVPPSLLRTGLFLGILFPLFLVAATSGFEIHKNLTHSALARRQAIATLTATMIKERLDRLMDLGTSLSTRVRFRQMVGEGRWQEAIQILGGVPKDFPIVERVILSDARGVLRADVPSVPEVMGKDFSYRDWFKGVSLKGEPYLSEAYRRMADPPYNVVAAAAPIRDPDGKLTGILVLQVKLDTLLAWSQEIPLEGDGIIYIAGRKGRAISHPDIPPQEELRDISHLAPVKAALRGEQGIALTNENGEKGKEVASYAPVPRYGWAVVVQQPARTVFRDRNRTLAALGFFYAAMALLSLFLGYVILSVIERLRHTARLLELSNKELESFSYSVSHDLRSPLRSIDGFSQILLEDSAKLNEKEQDSLKRVRTAVQRMGLLIDDMLKLSRVTRRDLVHETVDLSALAEEQAAEFLKAQPSRSVEFSIKPGMSAQGDRELLRSVIQNLLGNAWKFTLYKQKARIEFDSLEQEGKTVYFVRDDGAGFEMAYVGKLFGAFQRLHSEKEFSGTGVGLATVQRIIHRHGGRVWAEGALGKGATFYFTL